MNFKYIKINMKIFNNNLKSGKKKLRIFYISNSFKLKL